MHPAQAIRGTVPPGNASTSSSSYDDAIPGCAHARASPGLQDCRVPVCFFFFWRASAIPNPPFPAWHGTRALPSPTGPMARAGGRAWAGAADGGGWRARQTPSSGVGQKARSARERERDAVIAVMPLASGVSACEPALTPCAPLALAGKGQRWAQADLGSQVRAAPRDLVLCAHVRKWSGHSTNVT